MKILVVRLSSLGDILHLFPAISDLRGRFPEAEIHWLVEPAFAEMAGWHSAVNKVIAVPLRSHKKRWWKIPRLLRGLRQQLQAENYDIVLDAQGLLKSAILARLAGVDIYGFDADSARESLAARFYRKTASVPKGLHVIEKNRQLVAQLFDADISQPVDFGLELFRQKRMSESLPNGYARFPLPNPLPYPQGASPPGFRCDAATLARQAGEGTNESLRDFQVNALEGIADKPYIVLLHGTTWNSKYWPESSWLELVRLLTEQGSRCLLPWGNEEEHRRAQRLQVAGGELAQVLPKLSLTELMSVLLHARGFVSVESGIGHLATVLDIPGIMLHGPTDPAYSGILGGSCQHITSGLYCSPCFKRDCPRLESSGHVKVEAPDNVTQHARFPLFNFPPHALLGARAGARANERLREFHVKAGIPPCQQAITAQMVFHECMNLLTSRDADASRAC